MNYKVNLFFHLYESASGFRRNLECTPYARSWIFFQNFQNTDFCSFITLLGKKLQKWSLYFEKFWGLLVAKVFFEHCMPKQPVSQLSRGIFKSISQTTSLSLFCAHVLLNQICNE